MSSGSVTGFTESKFIVGAPLCADIRFDGRTAAVNNASASFMDACFMMRPLSASCARTRRRRLQDVFLHAPRFDLAQNDLVRIAAVQHVNDLESGRILPRLAELAEHASIQLGLVDLAGVVPRPWWIAVWVRIGEEHVLMGHRR